MYRIGFDAKRLFNNFTGLGNYSRTLVHDLQQNFSDNDYFLYSPKIRNHPETKLFFSGDFTLRTAKGPGKSLWRTSGIKKNLLSDDLDIYHGLSHELPLGIQKTNITSIVTIHDLIYKFHPGDFPFIDRKIYDAKFRYACKHADRVVAISEHTKRDIIEYFDIAPEKIDVVYQTCSSIFKKKISKEKKTAVAAKYKLPEQFLLYVGSIIERKNLLNLVKAIHSIKGILRIPLIVVGEGKAYKEEVLSYVKKHDLEKHIIFLKNITYADLPALYSLSKIFIYPSKYEGFGIPVIEALWTKTPVITSNVSSMPEAAGTGAHYVDPENAADIADGIIRLLTNKDYYVELMNNGFSHIQRKFTSKEIAEEMMKVYEKALHC